MLKGAHGAPSAWSWPRREVDAAVLRPALLGGFPALRARLAPADSLQPAAGYAKTFQQVFYRFRSAIAQLEVVLGRTRLVAMAFHQDLDAGEVMENSSQGIGVLCQRCTRILADLTLA